MSPQFVDFDADGKLDIVAATFDGSPHVARGTEGGFAQPVQILDRDGQRILLNQFWNYDTKKWDDTTRCDVENVPAHGHCTSALAVDWDGDGDLDLLLGDHDEGHVYLRRNEGTATKHAFAARNEPVQAGGKTLCVPGTVATMRLVDWNGDGKLDLACGSMGDAYGDGEGGGVYVFLNTDGKKGMLLADAQQLLAPSKKTSVQGPERPDSGIYMDFGDPDRDGDLDLVVGGYSHWKPPAPELSAQQKARAEELKAQLGELDQKLSTLNGAIHDATKGLAEEAAAVRRSELWQAQAQERSALSKARTPLHQEYEALVPGPKRESFVWLYENTTRAAAARASGAGGR